MQVLDCPDLKLEKNTGLNLCKCTNTLVAEGIKKRLCLIKQEDHDGPILLT